MTTEEAIQAMQFYQGKMYNGIYRQYIGAFDLAIAALRAQQEVQKNEPTAPCDLCAYNPPSSLDGKPCCMCPATVKNEWEKD